MIFSGVFTRRFRGFRVIDLLALTLVFVLALGSYVFTTLAGAQSADTAGVQAQIDQEEKRIRLLKAELAHLEDPGRIERLSAQYLGLGPVDPKRETTSRALAQIAASAASPKAASGAPKS